MIPLWGQCGDGGKAAAPVEVHSFSRGPHGNLHVEYASDHNTAANLLRVWQEKCVLIRQKDTQELIGEFEELQRQRGCEPHIDHAVCAHTGDHTCEAGTMCPIGSDVSDCGGEICHDFSAYCDSLVSALLDFDNITCRCV
eukprot:SAG11_NODE_674_length_7801_cov_3.578032_8_plen_140_part_00